MSEADEVAATLPPLPADSLTMLAARLRVLAYMPNESQEMIDNIAESLLERSTREALHSTH